MEYKVKFAFEDQTRVDTFLRALPGFTEFDSQWTAYSYREAENTGKMPNVEIRLETDGIYLCNFGSSNRLLGLMITRLVSQFGPVQIEDWG